MMKRIILLALLSLCIMSFVSIFHAPEAANTFKVEQIGVRM